MSKTHDPELEKRITEALSTPEAAEHLIQYLRASGAIKEEEMTPEELQTYFKPKEE